MNFFKLTISEIVKKIKKSTRQVNNGMGKTLFLRSQFERETGRPAETKVPLKKLLKKEEYLKDSTWVGNLCADGKLEQAIARAEKNIAAALESGTLEQQSYTFVYKVFKG